MRPPHYNSRPFNPNNQHMINGASASTPQQVMGNQGTFYPNPMQIRPQFQVGMLNNPQLAMPAFTNPNAFFAPNQFFPFPQGPLQFMPNTNNVPQLFGHNAVNSPQFMPNLVQNVNHLLQMQMSNCVPQNPGVLVNGIPGAANGNTVQPPVAESGLMHQNAALSKGFGSPQGQQNQNVFSPATGKSQSNGGGVNGANDKKNWRNSQNRTFNGNHKHDTSQRGFGKNKFHQRQNMQGNSKFNNENQGKGNKNIGMKNNASESQGGEKRSLMLHYTEQEIRKWREERRKYYPSKANTEKKLNANSNKSEVTDEAAQMRRQQLKEILTKQAELGCEVAEIPPGYLSEPNGRQQRNKSFGKRERNHTNFNKKGKFQQNNRYSKRQRSGNNEPGNPQGRFNNTKQRYPKKKDPSLLEKLLSSDIKRDKKHLLQVFRFMLMNSFFEAEEDLKFPAVIVNEPGGESDKPIVENQVVLTDGNGGEADDLDKDAASCSRSDLAAADDDESEICQEK